MSKRSTKTNLAAFLNPITIIVAVILLGGLVLSGLVVVFFGRSQPNFRDLTPVITMIPAPSLTPKQNIVASTPSPTPTQLIFLPEGEIGIGGYVQVTGTDGAGLRMRSNPGLSSEVNFTALDSEVFLVVDGPVEADDYIWWKLEAPYDKNRTGWSAGDFLTPIEESD